MSIIPISKVSDIHMFYTIQGTGDPLVIIPGWGRDLSAIDELIKDLSTKYQVIAIDNRGAGRSDKPDKPYSIEQMADDLIGLLDVLGIQRTNILAMSMGSMIGQVVAAKYPDRVQVLIIHVGFTRIPFMIKVFMNLMRFLPGSKRKIKEGMDMIFGQKYPPTSESFRRQGEAVARFDGRKYLSQIKAPTLIINGKRDLFVPEKISRELADGIPGAELILFDGEHDIWMSQREVLLIPVLNFLDAERFRTSG